MLLVRIAAANPNELEGTCEDCNEDRCFTKTDVVKCPRNQKLPSIELTLDDWWTVADVLKKHFDNPQWGEYAALLEYDVCCRSIISLDSLQLAQMYCMLAGTSRLRTPQEYFDLPAQYVDAVNVIENEKRLIRKEQIGVSN